MISRNVDTLLMMMMLMNILVPEIMNAKLTTRLYESYRLVIPLIQNPT